MHPVALADLLDGNEKVVEAAAPFLRFETGRSHQYTCPRRTRTQSRASTWWWRSFCAMRVRGSATARASDTMMPECARALDPLPIADRQWIELHPLVQGPATHFPHGHHLREDYAEKRVLGSNSGDGGSCPRRKARDSMRREAREWPLAPCL